MALMLAGAAFAGSAQAQQDGGVQEFGPPPNAKLNCFSTPTNANTSINPYPEITGVSIRSNCPNSGANPDGGAPLLVEDELDKRVHDLYVQSATLTGPVWVRLILPKNYNAADTTKKYPVLYLLTGHAAGFQSWTCNTLIQNYVQDAEVIVVMPDVSRKYDACARAESISNAAIPGWYSDWSQPSSDGNPEKWETFHTVELKQILLSKYKANGKFAIAGLSMGGLGAIKYAQQHRDMFSSAASYSGLLNTVSQEGYTAINGTLAEAGQNGNNLWGPYPGSAPVPGTPWYRNNPYNNANLTLANPALNLPALPMYVSAGNGGQGMLLSSYDAAAGTIETTVHAATINFVDSVKAQYNYTVPPNLKVHYYSGTHQWRYWDSELCKSLPMLLESIGIPAPFHPALACTNDGN